MLFTLESEMADLDVDEVANSIKQLVVGSGKFMQEANTYEQAEERILHLEENDDQFHKYVIQYAKNLAVWNLYHKFHRIIYQLFSVVSPVFVYDHPVSSLQLDSRSTHISEILKHSVVFPAHR